MLQTFNIELSQNRVDIEPDGCTVSVLSLSAERSLRASASALLLNAIGVKHVCSTMLYS